MLVQYTSLTKAKADAADKKAIQAAFQEMIDRVTRNRPKNIF
jgi:hypothetical protein